MALFHGMGKRWENLKCVAPGLQAPITIPLMRKESSLETVGFALATSSQLTPTVALKLRIGVRMLLSRAENGLVRLPWKARSWDIPRCWKLPFLQFQTISGGSDQWQPWC